jgi:hypothetical protein
VGRANQSVQISVAGVEIVLWKRLNFAIMKSSRDSFIRPKAVKPEHALQWLADPLLKEPTLQLKPWFGGRTIMLNGRHHLFLTTQAEPWQGVLVCTYHEHHDSLRADFPSLEQHSVLKKWLYLPESSDTFEQDAKRLVQLVKARDPRLGIEPSTKRKRKPGTKIRFGDRL